MKHFIRTAKITLIIALQVSLYFANVLPGTTSTTIANMSEYITYANVEDSVVIVPKKQKVDELVVQVAPKKFSAVLPTESRLDMQFYSQAPHGNWGNPYQNACEEMSMLLAHGYMTGRTYSKEQINQAVLQLTAFVKERGYEESMALSAVQDVVRSYFGINSVIIEHPTVDDIERSIVAGYPIIAPLAGRNLGNPHFMNEGPLYHVLVISGYTQTSFITQEVGTNFGQNYEYSKSTLLENIHDYTGVPEHIETGTPRVLVLLPS